MSSEVNHPSHYASGKIEVIEAIEDWKLDFPLGNAVKYVARAGKKDPAKEIQDLEKAVWYIRRKIEILSSTKTGDIPRRPNEMNPRDVVPLLNHVGGVEAQLIAEAAMNAKVKEITGVDFDELENELDARAARNLQFAEACRVFVRENFPSAVEYHKAMIFKGADFGREWESNR